MGGAAARADLGELGPQAPALAMDDVALSAMSLGSIQLLAALRISRHRFGSHAPQTANIRRKLPVSARGQARRHLGSFDAVPDHHEKRFVVAGAAQSGLRQNRALAPFTFGPWQRAHCPMNNCWPFFKSAGVV